MIKVENLSYEFPEKKLYNEVSFTLENGKHCAFIGTSGTGKSTLVDLLMHPEEYLYDGKIEMEEDCRIGYVSQFSQLETIKDRTVFEYISEAFTKLEKEIADLCVEMEHTEDMEEVFERYQKALDTFQSMDGENYQSNIKKQLKIAELQQYENFKVENLSGGEFKLVQVIKEMITAPALMIMDEPDVFLDFERLNGLRDLINHHKGTILVITHNRYLLDHCFNKILHLENMDIQEFDGRYLEYNFALLQKKIELQELALADLEEIERNKEVVDRLRRNATLIASSARGRALHARVSFLERLEARRVKEPFVEIRQPELDFKTTKILDPETVVLEATEVELKFDELLLEHVNFQLKATDKVAIVGPNGTGKTTLLNEIFRNENPAITIPEGVDVALLSQLQGEVLNEDHTAYEEFFDLGFETEKQVWKYLETYGFEREMLRSPIGNLSGGEKNVLQLAKMSVEDSNLLLLDEPTSHLDLYAQLALEKAIKNYNGAILMSSHDFYLIANCMDYVLMIKDQTVYRMSIRKFRKNIYAKHFDKNYLELEQKKKQLETRIAMALQDTDFDKAKELSEELEGYVNQMF